MLSGTSCLCYCFISCFFHIPDYRTVSEKYTQQRFKLMTLQTRCVHQANPTSRNKLFFHRVTDVEIKRGWADWHAPATRSCAGRQTSVQWHPPRECSVGARSGERGCHCSLWSQPSLVNLSDTEYKYVYVQMFWYYQPGLDIEEHTTVQSHSLVQPFGSTLTSGKWAR